MTTFANFLWQISLGWIIALFNLIVALLCFVTIIFIPVGLQFLKLARFSITPFGYDFVEEKRSGFNDVLNVIWAVLFGWEIMLGYFFTAVFLFITVIFSPFAFMHIKVGIFCLMPLGKKVKKIA